MYSKESLIPGHLFEATLNWGKGFSFRKGVVLEAVLLRRKVDMMWKTFSSSFVRDCGLFGPRHLIATQSFMLHRKQSDQEASVYCSNEVNGERLLLETWPLDLFCMVNRAS